MSDFVGLAKVQTMHRDFSTLRRAIKADHDIEAADDAWDMCERWLGCIDATAADRIIALQAENDQMREVIQSNDRIVAYPVCTSINPRGYNTKPATKDLVELLAELTRTYLKQESKDQTKATPNQRAAQALLDASGNWMPKRARKAAVDAYYKATGGCSPVAMMAAWQAALRAIVRDGK